MKGGPADGGKDVDAWFAIGIAFEQPAPIRDSAALRHAGEGVTTLVYGVGQKFAYKFGCTQNQNDRYSDERTGHYQGSDALRFQRDAVRA